jgi:hypothetical protein
MFAGPFPKRVGDKPPTTEPGRNHGLNRCRDRDVRWTRLARPDLTERPSQATERGREDHSADHVERTRLAPVLRREGCQYAHSEDRDRRVDPEH